MRMYRDVLRKALTGLHVLLAAGLCISVYQVVTMELPGVEEFDSSRPVGQAAGSERTTLTRLTSDQLRLLWESSKAEVTSPGILTQAIALADELGVTGHRSEVTPLPFVLQGSICSSLPSESEAFIQFNGATARYTAGSVLAGWTIVKIDRISISVKKGDETRILTIETKAGKTSGSVRSVSENTGRAGRYGVKRSSRPPAIRVKPTKSTPAGAGPHPQRHGEREAIPGLHRGFLRPIAGQHPDGEHAGLLRDAQRHGLPRAVVSRPSPQEGDGDWNR